MTRLPAVSGAATIKALHRAGFYIHHQNGSHVTLRKEGQPQVRVVVPLQRVVKKGTLRNIISDSGLTIEEFVALL